MAEQRKCRKLASVFVEHQDYFGAMTDEDCQWAIQNPKGAVALFASAVKNRGAGRSIPVWREQDGIIRVMPVTTDGTAGKQWVRRLEIKGNWVEPFAQSVLLSDDFASTVGVTMNIVILNDAVVGSEKRTARAIEVYATSRRLRKPNAEMACFLRELLMDTDMESMGLYRIAIMHKPMNDPAGDSNYLCLGGFGEKLSSYRAPADHVWPDRTGFAYIT